MLQERRNKSQTNVHVSNFMFVIYYIDDCPANKTTNSQHAAALTSLWWCQHNMAAVCVTSHSFTVNEWINRNTQNHSSPVESSVKRQSIGSEMRPNHHFLYLSHGFHCPAPFRTSWVSSSTRSTPFFHYSVAKNNCWIHFSLAPGVVWVFGEWNMIFQTNQSLIRLCFIVSLIRSEAAR